MKHLGAKTIETERLILRKFKVIDADMMYKNWASDDNVTKFLTWPTHNSVEISKYVLMDWEEKAKSNDNYQWCIVLKQTGEAIGSIGVVQLMETIDTAEIGYCIGSEFWNKGITTEALRSVINFLFNQVEVNRIEAGHDVNNPASGKVMQKCGLRFEGIQRKRGRNNVGICDMAVYGMLKEDQQ
jgi:ribosomal-protein-alanine N-acetyltransferase